jgi:hypothetical protein
MEKMLDRRTTYSRLREMLKGYTKGNEISFAKLENLIIMSIGSSARTVSDSMRTMARTKLIEDIGDGKFRIVRLNLE